MESGELCNLVWGAGSSTDFPACEPPAAEGAASLLDGERKGQDEDLSHRGAGG